MCHPINVSYDKCVSDYCVNNNEYTRHICEVITFPMCMEGMGDGCNSIPCNVKLTSNYHVFWLKLTNNQKSYGPLNKVK